MIKEQESELEQSIILPDQEEPTGKYLVASAAQPALLKVPGGYKPAQSAAKLRFLSPAAHTYGKPNFSDNNTDDREQLMESTGSSRRFARILKHTVMHLPGAPNDLTKSPVHHSQSFNRNQSLLSFKDS